MALALRIDSITATAGSIQVFYTFGNTPLPASPSGQAMTYTNRQAVVDIKNAVIGNVSADMMLKFAYAIYAIAANDPNLLNAATNLPGKTLTVDATLPNSVMSYA